MPEPISESQLRLYPNIMVEDTAHTINKKVGWLLHGQESILVPDFNTKCQCQITGEGIGFLPDYMVREAMEKSLLVTRQIHNPRQDSRMLLATQHSATGRVTQWIKKRVWPTRGVDGNLSGFAASGVMRRTAVMPSGARKIIRREYRRTRGFYQTHVWQTGTAE